MPTLQRGGAQGHQASRGVTEPEHADLRSLPRQIGRRVKAAAVAAGLGEGFTGPSGRVGMAQDLAKTGAEPKSPRSPIGRLLGAIMSLLQSIALL